MSDYFFFYPNLGGIKVKKILKYATIAGLTLATISGTCTGNKEGLTPLYNRKVGASGGICIGILNSYESGSRFYGISISVATDNAGEINGVNLAVANASKDGKVTGLEAGLVNMSVNDKGITYKPVNLNGLQIGAYNEAMSRGNLKRGIGLNLGFGGNEEK